MNAFIFGGEYTDEQEDFYSLQNQVSNDTPPVFIWHTSKDGLIYPSNSLLFVTELAKNDVEYELHIYSDGDPGLSLANHITANNPFEIVPCAQSWIEHALDWVSRKTMHK